MTISIRNQLMTYLVAILVVSTLATVFLLLEDYFVEPQPSMISTDGELSDTQKESLHLYFRLTKMFIGFSTASIGAVAYFVKSDFEKKERPNTVDICVIGLVFACFVTSIFFGHLLVQHLADSLARKVEMLTPSTSDSPVYIRLRLLFRWQYYAFLGGVIVFSGFIVSRMRHAGTEEK